MPQLDVLDISSWQLTIDWSSVEYPSILKASEGRAGRDVRFPANLPAARSVGRCAGFYHFLTSTVPGDVQAANFLRTINESGGMLAGERMVLDHEKDPYTGTEPQHYWPIAQEFIDTIAIAGHHSDLIYYGHYWMAQFAHDNGLPLWCTAFIPGPQANEEYQRFIGACAWQYSSTLNVNGIPTRVDGRMLLDSARFYGETDMDGKELGRLLDCDDYTPDGKPLFKLRDGSLVTFKTLGSYLHQETQVARFKLMGTNSGAVDPALTVTQEVLAGMPKTIDTTIDLNDDEILKLAKALIAQLKA